MLQPYGRQMQVRCYCNSNKHIANILKTYQSGLPNKRYWRDQTDTLADIQLVPTSIKATLFFLAIWQDSPHWLRTVEGKCNCGVCLMHDVQCLHCVKDRFVCDFLVKHKCWPKWAWPIFTGDDKWLKLHLPGIPLSLERQTPWQTQLWKYVSEICFSICYIYDYNLKHMNNTA